MLGDTVLSEALNMCLAVKRYKNYPCGKCFDCKLRKTREWSYRILNECSLYDNNMMITLTYNDKNLPADKQLNYRHVQLFLKKLRKYFYPKKIRFFCSGEYGKKHLRPHYHLIIFDCLFDDLYFYKKDKKGTDLYRSPQLEKLWTFGFSCVVKDLTYDACFYVAKYLQKSSPSGTSPFVHMSLKPGIGAKWLDTLSEKKIESLLKSEKIYHNGHYTSVPRYYYDYIARLGYETEVNLTRFYRRKSVEYNNTLALMDFDRYQKKRRDRLTYLIKKYGKLDENFMVNT